MIGPGLYRKRIVSPLQFLVLLDLKNGPKYGYEMLKEIRNEFNGLWKIETGTFYPALKSLEKRKLIISDTKNETTYYNITENGNQMLESFGNNISEQFEFSEKFFDIIIKWLPKSFIEIMLNIFTKKMIKRQRITRRLPAILKHIPVEKKVAFLEEVTQFMKSDLAFLENYLEEVKNFE